MLKERGGRVAGVRENEKKKRKKKDLIKQSVVARRRIWSRKCATKMIVQFPSRRGCLAHILDLIVKTLMPDCGVSPAADLLSPFTPPPQNSHCLPSSEPNGAASSATRLHTFYLLNDMLKVTLTT